MSKNLQFGLLLILLSLSLQQHLNDLLGVSDCSFSTQLSIHLLIVKLRFHDTMLTVVTLPLTHLFCGYGLAYRITRESLVCLDIELCCMCWYSKP